MPKPKSDKAVATIPSKNEVANVDLTKQMEADAGMGVSTSLADNVVPLLKILQAMSPQVLKQKAESYIKGAQPGNIYPRGERIVWDGEEGITCVPCFHTKTWIEWGPELGDGLRGKHPHGDREDETPPADLNAVQKPDPKDSKRRIWVTPEGNVLQFTREIAVLVIDKGKDPIPFLIPFNSTNLSVGKDWNSKANRMYMDSGKTFPLFAHSWKLVTVGVSNEKGAWFKWQLDPSETKLVSPQVYQLARKIHMDFSKGALVGDTAGYADDTVDSGM